jgi:hypothetical protein
MIVNDPISLPLYLGLIKSTAPDLKRAAMNLFADYSQK